MHGCRRCGSGSTDEENNCAWIHAPYRDHRDGGDAGDDTLQGEAGNDSLYGGAGLDKLYGNDDADYLVGESGSDKLYGGAGMDTLQGDSDVDELRGGPNNDTLLSSGVGEYYGEGDNDTVSYESWNRAHDPRRGRHRRPGRRGRHQPAPLRRRRQ